jgi:cytochrome c oxidase subunit II
MSTSSRRSRAVAAAASSTGLLLLAGCAKNAPQDTWKPQGPDAQKIDDLQRFPFYAAGIVGVLVTLLVGYVVWRFRDRGQPVPKQTHGNTAVEIGSLAFSAVLLAAVGVVSVDGIAALAKTDDCKMVVNVTGQQWWWEYAYPPQEGIPQAIVASGELVIPTGQCVLLRITSRDVIHSFWIPALNGKRDAVPNRTHVLRLEADHEGIYDGQCTEFCGLSHANMKMNAVALNAEHFARWVADQTSTPPVPPPPAAGEPASAERAAYDQFTQCVRCHQVYGRVNADGSPQIAKPEDNLVSGTAPNLTRFASRTTFAGATYDMLNDRCRNELRTAKEPEFGEIYLKGVTEDCLNVLDLKTWLRNPQAQKAMAPTDEGLGRGMPNLHLNEETIDQLVEYLLSTNPANK